MYCTDEGGKSFRAGIANVLGGWHSYKMACKLVYRTMANTVFAPLFHNTCPGHTFYPTPKRLIVIQHTFTLVRLAFDGEVDKALQEARDDQKCNDNMRMHLKNLRDLAQFTIPAVSCDD